MGKKELSFTVARDVDIGGEMSLSERWIRVETEQIGIWEKDENRL